jgi:hypothetical protein
MPIIGVIASSGDRNVPDAPTIGTATNVGTGRAYNNGRADVTFTAPVYTGGTPITGYTVTSSPGGFTGTGASSPISVTGLQSNTAYTFTVTATNAVGTSAPSAASNSITATTVPQAPTIGTATDLGTGTTVSVAFTGNATGGSAITGYTATSSPSSITGTGASSPITVSGLTAGTAYTFTVTATNANGTSLASAASNSVTPQVPGSFESIATATPAGVSTITFSSIPSTYKHLQIRIFGLASGGGASDTYMQFNADTGPSNTNYAWKRLRGIGSGVTVGSSGLTNKILVGWSVGTSPAIGGASIIDISDYSSTAKNKTVRSFYGYDTNATVGNETTLGSGVWANTSAINSIRIFTETGETFASGMSVALYGIKG